MRLRKIGTLGIFFLLTACVLRPQWQHLARTADLETVWLDTGQFQHLLLKNNAAGKHLRIYIEGDGTPWIRTDRVSIDPTPTNPVMLRLMADSADPAVYLGRPCYFGTATSSRCDQRWWTFERYGDSVVSSMCDAANEIGRSVDSVELIGYSGGGAIAIRMSACTRKLTMVTTIAGNLDPDAWTAYHDFSPLLPATGIERLPPIGIAEVHWQCRTDENIPPSITDAYFAARPHAVRHVVGDCTHSTGWEKVWPQIIAGTLAITH